MTAYANVTFAMALPRSRTAWIARTFAELLPSHHEPLRECASIGGLQAKVDRMMADAPGKPLLLVDTAAAFFHHEIGERFPGARWLFIVRDPRDVRRSMVAAGLPSSLVDTADRYLQDARANADGMRAMTVRYEDLNNPATLNAMLGFIGVDPRSDTWWEERTAYNIQLTFAAMARGTNDTRTQALFATRRELR